MCCCCCCRCRCCCCVAVFFAPSLQPHWQLSLYFEGSLPLQLYSSPPRHEMSMTNVVVPFPLPACLSVYLFSSSPSILLCITYINEVYGLSVVLPLLLPLSLDLSSSLSHYSLYSCSLISMLVYLTISCFSIVLRSKYIQTISLLYLSVCLAFQVSLLPTATAELKGRNCRMFPLLSSLPST